MWKGKAAAFMQRTRGAHRNGGRKMLLPAGAAASLLLLEELDRHQFPNEEDRMRYKVQQWLQRQQEQLCNNAAAGTATTATSTNNINTTLCEGGDGLLKVNTRHRQSTPELKRFQTLRKMDEDSTQAFLESCYKVDWNKPLGEGAFGAVFLGIDKETGEKVAVKKISKRYTNEEEFYREMNALLHLRKAGGHPNICSLREHFNERGHYYLILDLVAGGELFDHLVSQGAYSEADAARLMREVASALLFLHGLSVVHGDLKPENLMLSSKNPSDAVIKLVDFGCAQVNKEMDGMDSEDEETTIAGKTLAYCPPEVLQTAQSGKSYMMKPSMDLWAVGVILYIMLTGLHPYDIRGQASDEEVAEAIMSGKPPPLRNSPITAHLSDSSLELIESLMTRDPAKRIDAYGLLQHPWVRGETASQYKMENSGKKLSMFHKYKSGIERKVFENLITSSDDNRGRTLTKGTSLIEQSFRWFDPENKGHITQKDLEAVITLSDTADRDAAPLSLSGFSDLLSEHMQNRYFPKGHIVYHEGEVGNRMFFISSGKVRVTTSTGTSVTRGPGDFFGEGALLHPKKLRSATIQCVTPVHALEVTREYFDKYLARSDKGLYLFLKEKDNIRKKNRAKMILQAHKNLKERKFRYGEVLFDSDEDTDTVYIVDEGKVDLKVGGHTVFAVFPGNMCGENSALTQRSRNASAICASKNGCTVHTLAGSDFRKLLASAPDMETSLRDLGYRRDFKKAVVLRLNSEFPYDNPKEAFNVVKSDKSMNSDLTKEELAKMMREFDPRYEDAHLVDELIKTMDLTQTGTVSYDEFKKVFIADIKGSASI